jgi:uncharacterized protein (TIGR02145 family)
LGDAIFTLPQKKDVVSIYDGTPILDIQGYITNTAPNQFIINVPYTGGIGSYTAYTSSVVTSTAGQGGDVNGFTISYPAGTFAASGTIPVTVTVDGDGSYAVKKQLFGIQETIATLPFVSNGTNRGNIVLGVTGGISDRAFGQTINGANNHNFIYLPVTGADGKTWLNNNLGANYSNKNYIGFDPSRQATGFSDFMAYGSLFQWGRAADGHELLMNQGGTAGTPVNGTTTTLSSTDTPLNSKFIYNGSPNYDWRSSQNDNLWQGVNGTNNPCPVGYRLPTDAEWTALVTAAGITNKTTAAASSLKLTVPGRRAGNSGTLYDIGGTGYYWSSTVSVAYAVRRNFDLSMGSGTNGRADGFTVRCLKD